MVMRHEEMRREEAVLTVEDAHHRAMRRCHGCGAYARPIGEFEGRLLCERCAEKLRRESSEPEVDLNTLLT